MHAPLIAAKRARFEHSVAAAVAAEICRALGPYCERIEIAGSLRRKKPTVGDIEILYIPRTAIRHAEGDFFSQVEVFLTDDAIMSLEEDGTLTRRKNVNGSETYGVKNKLMLHLPSAIPVDLFAATAEGWWNYLVCRTGPAESNVRICEAAKKVGWKWNPYGVGFSHSNGGRYRVKSEADVFEFVGLPYRPPEERQ